MEDEKVYHVSVDSAANDRMAEHFDFLSRVSENAAIRLLDELLAGIRTLEKTPYQNPIFDRPYLPPGKYRHLIISKRYRIVYQIDGNFVYVDDIQQ